MKFRECIQKIMEREDQYRPGDSRNPDGTLKAGWGEFPVCPVSKRVAQLTCAAAKLRDFKLTEAPTEKCDLCSELDKLEDG